MLIGSSDGNGNADVTPKGDRPGFAAVLDDTTIAIPDRPGNNRLDTLENILVNPSVGLLFLIPGMNETLRVNGEARITAIPALRERLAVEGRLPTSVMVVTVKAAYMHCAKAFMRSELWKPESWSDRARCRHSARSSGTSWRSPIRPRRPTAGWTTPTEVDVVTPGANSAASFISCHQFVHSSLTGHAPCALLRCNINCCVATGSCQSTTGSGRINPLRQE